MLGEAIRSILLSDTTVPDLVDTRIFPSELPLDCTFPALTYSIISDPFQIVMRSARCQINCWDLDYSARETLKDAVENALKFYTGLIEGVSIEIIWPVGSYNHYTDDASGYSYIPIDFKINYYTN